MKGEPRYSKKERKARKAEIEELRRRAVKSWNDDAVGEVAIVMMTFSDYLLIAPLPIGWLKPKRSKK